MEFYEGCDSLLYERRENGANSKYLFISYAHDDSAAVIEKLIYFHKQGLNFWYDIDLQSGDNWETRCKGKLDSNQCVGIVFFVSPTSLTRPSIETEMTHYINNYFEDGKDIKRKPHFLVFIDADDMYDIRVKAYKKVTKDTVDTCEKNCQTLKLLCPENKEIFSKIDSTDLSTAGAPDHNFENAINNIIATLGAVSNDRPLLTLLKRKGVIWHDGSTYTYTFGRYPQTTADLSNLAIGKESEVSPIEWIVLDANDGKLRLISKFGLQLVNINPIFYSQLMRERKNDCDFVTKMYASTGLSYLDDPALLQQIEKTDAIKKWLFCEIFKYLTADERSMIKGAAQFASAADLKILSGSKVSIHPQLTELLKSMQKNPSATAPWLAQSSSTIGSMYSFVKKDGTLAPQLFSGVDYILRPVIEICIDKIMQ